MTASANWFQPSGNRFPFQEDRQRILRGGRQRTAETFELVDGDDRKAAFGDGQPLGGHVPREKHLTAKAAVWR